MLRTFLRITVLLLAASAFPFEARGQIAAQRTSSKKKSATPSLSREAPAIGRDRATTALSFSGKRHDRPSGNFQAWRPNPERPTQLPNVAARPVSPSRPNVVVNRPNRQINDINVQNNANVQNIVNNVTNVTNVVNQNVNNTVINNFGGNYGGNYINNAHPWRGRYDYCHQHWHGGYWNFRYRPTIWLNPAIGLTLGAGPVVRYAFVNPYLINSSTVYLSGYDYSNPIRPASDDEVSGRVTEEAIRRLDAARDAFRAQQYPRCLELAESAIRLLPDDSIMHELRGLALFAMGDYETAATVVYAVLGGGPGSDWNAISSLYERPEIYAGQLRRLSEFVALNPDRTGPRFLLAYHLLVVGRPDVAYAQLAEVQRRRPDDRVTSELMRALSQQSNLP